MRTTFSAIWTEQLGKVILDKAPTIYPMELVNNDALTCMNAVNQGIDARLQACYVPARGDNYTVHGNRLICKVSKESLPVLVRRLMESGNEHAESLASSICETLGIELI
jgi:hypothetical protein